MAADIPKNVRMAMVSLAFSPSAPVDDADLFAGRPNQVGQCISALFQKGQHIALYGERGVGKTSLSKVLPKMVRDAKTPLLHAVRIDCGTQDTFGTIWSNIFRELGLRAPEGSSGRLSPEDVRFMLQALKQDTLIVIDELDRMEDDEGLTQLADTIKTLSDHAVPATLMLVGVADTVTELVGEHESILRSLEQVLMPRMSDLELGKIIDTGILRANLTIEPAARSEIISVSEGLPHFIHLLALYAGQRAVADDRSEITIGHVVAAMHDAVERHTMKAEYSKATGSSQPGSRYEEVLLACAYARRDELGYFRAGDVRAPLAVILARQVDIPNFQRHLTELSSLSRGSTLHKDGSAKRFRYRFHNPLLQPYTKIRALSKQLITQEQRASLERIHNPCGRASGQGQLFGESKPEN